jgi:hypothetical protein
LNKPEQIDVLDSKGCWCAVEVAGFDEEDQVLVHFLGYSSVYDEFISTTSSRLAPAFTFTKVEPEESAVGLNLLESFPIEPILALKSFSHLSKDYIESMFPRYGSNIHLISGLRWKHRNDPELANDQINPVPK